jgi:hypothetical protein
MHVFPLQFEHNAQQVYTAFGMMLAKFIIEVGTYLMHSYTGAGLQHSTQQQHRTSLHHCALAQ